MPRKPKQPRATRSEPDRRVRQADRLARLLRILQRIQGKGQWTSKSLAAEEECSERTIFRALQALELAGVPWYFDEVQRCYRVRPDYRFPTLNLTGDEAVSQATAAAMSSITGPKLASGVKQTLQKIESTTKEPTAQLLSDAERLIAVLGFQMADHSRHQDAIRTVQWALLDRKQLVGQYRSPYEDRTVSVRLHPYRLCLVKQAWYLVGRQAEEQQPKTFRVARFKSLRMIDAAAEVPTEFDLKRYFGDAWAVYRGTQKFDVEIEFSKEAANLVTETVWHPTQKSIRQRNGSVRLQFRVDGLNEIVHWVLGWSDRAKVIEPAELRVLVVHHLRNAIRRYRSSTADEHRISN